MDDINNSPIREVEGKSIQEMLGGNLMLTSSCYCYRGVGIFRSCWFSSSPSPTSKKSFFAFDSRLFSILRSKGCDFPSHVSLVYQILLDPLLKIFIILFEFKITF